MAKYNMNGYDAQECSPESDSTKILAIKNREERRKKHLQTNRQDAYRKLLLRQNQDRIHWRASHEGTERKPLAHQPILTTATQALCHCADCRKISGGNYSNNFVLPGPSFKLLSGTPKEISKTADSGKPITNYFCGDCGTTLFRKGETFGDSVILKAGVLDDVSVLNAEVPGAELYAPERIKWLSPVKDAGQVDAMPQA